MSSEAKIKLYQAQISAHMANYRAAKLVKGAKRGTK